MEKYGKWIRNLRGTRSSREFAQLLGISQQALQAYESGKRIPRDEVKQRAERISLREALFSGEKEHLKCTQKGEYDVRNSD